MANTLYKSDLPDDLKYTSLESMKMSTSLPGQFLRENVNLNRKNHQIKHFVEQQMYMKYDIGDKIEVFVSQNDKVKIYPVDELR